MNELWPFSAARAAPRGLAITERAVRDRHVEALVREPHGREIVLSVARVPALENEAAGRPRDLGEGDGDGAEFAAAVVARFDPQLMRVVLDDVGEAGEVLV